MQGVWFPPHKENYVTTTGVENPTRLRGIRIRVSTCKCPMNIRLLTHVLGIGTELLWMANWGNCIHSFNLTHSYSSSSTRKDESALALADVLGNVTTTNGNLSVGLLLSLLFNDAAKCQDYIALMIGEWIWSSSGLKMTEGDRSTWRKTCPGATLSTTNLKLDCPQRWRRRPTSRPIARRLVNDHVPRCWDSHSWCQRLRFDGPLWHHI